MIFELLEIRREISLGLKKTHSFQLLYLILLFGPNRFSTYSIVKASKRLVQNAILMSQEKPRNFYVFSI